VGATLLGIIPGAFVFASVGTGLGEVFKMGADFSAAGLLTPKVITALVGLAVLALAPIVYKKFCAR
jgi:phosphoglycerol transferase MdoB-like AlkP superfamily enzyme